LRRRVVFLGQQTDIVRHREHTLELSAGRVFVAT